MKAIQNFILYIVRFQLRRILSKSKNLYTPENIKKVSNLKRLICRIRKCRDIQSPNVEELVDEFYSNNNWTVGFMTGGAGTNCMTVWSKKGSGMSWNVHPKGENWIIENFSFHIPFTTCIRKKYPELSSVNIRDFQNLFFWRMLDQVLSREGKSREDILWNP